MPLYEYLCPGCKLKFELLRKASESDEMACCPRCQNSAGRVPSTFASFSKDAGGVTTSIGGSACSGCDAGSCQSCNH